MKIVMLVVSIEHNDDILSTLFDLWIHSRLQNVLNDEEYTKKNCSIEVLEAYPAIEITHDKVEFS